MDIGFTGTRHGLTEAQKGAVQAILEALAPDSLRHGDCVGADAEVHGICERQGICTVIHPPSAARHRAHCKGPWVTAVRDPAPYRERNRAIVEACDLLLACPSGQEAAASQRRSGTWMTIRMARAARKPVHIVYPNGIVIPE